MTENQCLKTAKKLAGKLHLKAIHLWKAKNSREISFKAKKADVRIEIRASALKANTANILPFACGFTFTGVEKEENKEVFQIDATFCVVYQFTNKYSPTDEEIQAFALTSAVFNAWPYVREYVQNTMQKMDLPVFFLNPITISDLAKIAKNENEVQELPVCEK